MASRALRSEYIKKEPQPDRSKRNSWIKIMMVAIVLIFTAKVGYTTSVHMSDKKKQEQAKVVSCVKTFQDKSCNPFHPEG